MSIDIRIPNSSGLFEVVEVALPSARLTFGASDAVAYANIHLPETITAEDSLQWIEFFFRGSESTLTNAW